MLPATQGEGQNENLSLIQEAFSILAQGAPKVAKSLVQVATEGKSEIAKVQASQIILDRIGLHGRVDIGVTGTHLVGVVDAGEVASGAADTVRKRLDKLREQHALTKGADDGEGVVIVFPGSVVEDEQEEQETE